MKWLPKGENHMTRVAIVGGARTAFLKAGGKFSRYSYQELAQAAIEGALERTGIGADVLDELVLGSVLLDPRTPNAAREIVLRSSKLPNTLPAHFVSNNCISGLVAASWGAEAIRAGRIRSVIAAGAESMSRPSLSFSAAAERFYLQLFSARSLSERLKILASFRPPFVLPIPPSPKEPSTGLTMGEHCELSAKEFSISRQSQDLYACRSHQNAFRAQQAGVLKEEIVSLHGIDADNLIRGDTSVEKLNTLRPVFDRSEKGSITAGNASALTDGAAAVILMSEERAREVGASILGYLEAIEYAAVDPKQGLLMAPGLALPKLLERQQLRVADIDRFEIHEAFAAQVLANREIWKKGWKAYPSLTGIGEIPDEKINVNGGSLALGHPFAATGGRILLSLVHELKRSGKNTGVISVCAAGGMAAAALIRAE
jgi:acetyl-CoA acetyltransferase family protein